MKSHSMFLLVFTALITTLSTFLNWDAASIYFLLLSWCSRIKQSVLITMAMVDGQQGT